MHTQTRLGLALAREFQQQEIERAALERRFSTPRPSIRRTLGRRVIAVGQRIAAEPSLELARSR
ncbi:MAG TPA: hypothetical protein VD763_03185 [Candidatus Saccharimonadales bacterium]|nr:hypothetical protein [Candidatus Saccharimonadales bacterium]